MCAPYHLDSEIPDWVRSIHAFARKHRDIIRPATAFAVTVAALVGLLVYMLSPTDLERAEADIIKGQAVANALVEEATQQANEARGHDQCAAEYREAAAEVRGSTDTAHLELSESSAHAHKQLSKAKWARRDHVLHLAAEYRRLLAEAECEILRAKDASDRGTPYKVAPRVREILAPVLNTH